MLFEVKNGTLSQGGNEILSHFDFCIKDNEKIGIVGRNGAGKTTLLKFITSELSLDYNDDNTKGTLIKSDGYNIGYLKQNLVGLENNKDKSETAEMYLLHAFDNLITMEKKIEELTEDLSKEYTEKKALDLNDLIDKYNLFGGNTYKKELNIGFNKFGFTKEDFKKDLTAFSGGQNTKLSLLKLLLSKPDVLVLDEPTNHLDIEAINWMEKYLVSYKKNVIIVSHDRMFLDNVCNVIYDVEHKILTRYECNYTDYVYQKEINYELALAKYNNNLKEIERLTMLTDRFRYKATKAKMVKSKDKIIEKLEKETYAPIKADTKTFDIKIIPLKAGGKEVFRADKLSIGYDKEITNVDVLVNRRDRLAILGENGIGKSTFVKTIVGKLDKLSGEYSFGHEIEFEYFDQKNAEIYSEKSVFDDFFDEFPTYTNTEVRNRLGRFLFTEEDVLKKVKDLSGGEKVRLALAKIFERRPNLLILDEPTNHLDILGKESLEKIIDNFEGTVILVSHDRYFVKKVANKILYFEKNDKIETKFFEFGYEDFDKYLLLKEKKVNDEEIFTNKKNENKNNDYLLKKIDSKNKKKSEKLEEEIVLIEEKIKNLEKMLEDEDIQKDYVKLGEINSEIEKNNELLKSKYNSWDELNSGNL